MNRNVALALRVTLVFFLVSSLLAQVLIPIIAADIGKNLLELQHLVVPYSVLAIVAILIFQVALIALWKLVSLAASSRIFTPVASRLCRVIQVSAITATVVVSLTLGHLIFIEQNGGPGALYALVIGLFVGSAIALTMYVLGEILDTATREHNELKEVI